MAVATGSATPGSLEETGTLVVVGASLAGLRAVEAARRTGWRGRLVLVGAEERAPYDRPPLTKSYLHAPLEDRVAAQVVGFHPTEHLRDELGVELRLGAAATGLDTGARELHLGAEVVLYDALVIATGAAPRPFPGDHLDGVHHLRTAEDARAVRIAIASGARTVVVGAGFIGSEVASALRSHGRPVTVVEAATVPLAHAVGEVSGRLLARLHGEAGTDLRLGVGVAGLEQRDGSVTGVRLEDGTVLPADLVVLGVGVAPATSWLEGSGVVLHELDRGVVCDERLATRAPGVWAAGDVAHVPEPLNDGELARLEHWTSAAEQGALAARHALDPGAARPLVSVPYFWSDWYGHRMQLVGTTRAEEVLVVAPADGSVSGSLVLHRRGDRLVGVLAVDGQRVVMKLRRRIVEETPWADAVAAAREVVGPGPGEDAGSARRELVGERT